MSRRRRANLAAVCAVAASLLGCASDSAAPATSSPSTSPPEATATTAPAPATAPGSTSPFTSASTSPSTSTSTSIPTSTEAIGDAAVVQAAIDIGGEEAYGLTADASNIWAISYQAGTLVRIDPSTNTVTATTTIGPGAASVLSDGSDLWIASYGQTGRDGAIYRVDPATATTTATIKVGEVCCDLSFGNGLLWMVDPSGSVKAIDPATNAIAAQFDVPIDRLAHTNAVFAGGFVWVSSDTTALYRIDPKSGAVDDFDIGGGVPFIARDGLVWGASPTMLWAINEANGDVVNNIDLKRSSEVLSLDAGTTTLWVGIRHPGGVGAVEQIDIATGAVLNEFNDVEIPARIVAAFDSAWITESGGSQVFRIGPLLDG